MIGIREDSDKTKINQLLLQFIRRMINKMQFIRMRIMDTWDKICMDYQFIINESTCGHFIVDQ
jgi:hypothetical protein